MKPVRILKLFLISIVVFSIVLFCLSLLFPSTTYVSRAVNVYKTTRDRKILIPELYNLAFQDNKEIDFFKTIPDTFQTVTLFSSDVHQGLALHELSNDSTAVQVFYTIHAPWYKPWKKFALMLNETKYGPSLDSAISRISRNF